MTDTVPQATVSSSGNNCVIFFFLVAENICGDQAAESDKLSEQGDDIQEKIVMIRILSCHILFHFLASLSPKMSHGITRVACV